jgi:hypothetical protein
MEMIRVRADIFIGPALFSPQGVIDNVFSIERDG